MPKKKKKAKWMKPDEHLTWGPFELTRFGKVTVMKSHLTAEQIAKAQAQMAERFPTLVAELDALVLSIAHQIARLPPALLLRQAWREFAMINIGKKVSDELDQLAAMRMIDYTQSVIASIKPETYLEKISEDDWNKLKADVALLFDRLTSEYQICLTGYRKVQDPSIDMELEEFRVRMEMLWLNIRGKRYHIHERQALLEMLDPHADVFLQLFDIDVVNFVNELDKILIKLTRGLDDSMQELSSFQDDTLDRLEKLANEHTELSLEALRDKIFEDEDFAARRERIGGYLFGMDLFDVAKNTALPKALLNALTWSPGENTEFFAPGEYSGWPLRIWPIMKRPFIRLDGRVYCFDMFSLFDNIYRILQRLILQRKPTYSRIWNDEQKRVSEELPLIFLGRLLPGARIFQTAYYRWSVNGGPKEWYETDGLIIFDDHLIVVEVKAGAFTYTSPANDLAAHLESLRGLLQAPARQGSRFVDYLESGSEVSIADKDHNEIDRLRQSDFQHITVCTVTLDAFGSLAARAQHLTPLGIDVGKRPVWPVSIDDLRVYSELFDNPLSFLHFVEHRIRANQSKDLDLDDEMDHLGLYIVHNNYSRRATELKGNQLDRLKFNGFRTPIDEYYTAMFRGETPTLVRQKMPQRLAEIIHFLGLSNEPHRSKLASFLLDAAGDFRDTLAKAIEEALQKNKELQRARPLSFSGAMAMTLYIWSPLAPRLDQDAIYHARVVMVLSGETSQRLVELEYNEDDALIGAHMISVNLEGLSMTEIERIQEASIALLNQRICQAQTKEKIGRNDPCPCGSGKKFKYCHNR